MSTALLSSDPVVLSQLLAEGAAAQEANMKYIGALESANQKQASDILLLKGQVQELQKQAKQASAQGITLTQEQAEKYASLLVEQNEISAADKPGAVQTLLSEPSRIFGVFDKLASLLRAPALPRNGNTLPRGGSRKFASEAGSPPKEVWFEGQTAK